MTLVMTIATGVALGYFLVQFVTKNNRFGTNREEDTEVIRAEENENTLRSADKRLKRTLPTRFFRYGLTKRLKKTKRFFI